ncbi:MAG: 23S rRNA (pseudouridine(1915)-N(3))-methyltransferase RlmH [Thermodesulfobacteriota bacterium]
MKITFVLTGTLKKSYLRDGFAEYVKRISRYCALEVAEIKDSEYGKKSSHEAGLRKEAERIEKCLAGKGAMRVALTERKAGKTFTSKAFSEFIDSRLTEGRDIAFIIGGPYGLDRDLIKGSEMALSLSAMTLPHEMAALVLAEQVYRAFTILRGEPYSH